MFAARKLRPGTLRWPAAGLVLVTLAAWLGFAFWWQAEAMYPRGRTLLRSGCIEIEYGLRELPPQFQVATLQPWPPWSTHRITWGPRTEQPLIWWPDTRVSLTTSGSVTSTTGPNPVISASVASVWRTIDIPLWPAVLAASAAAMISWRRHARRAPDQCPSCAYDRRGLPPDAKCPECGTVPTPAASTT